MYVLSLGWSGYLAYDYRDERWSPVPGSSHVYAFRFDSEADALAGFFDSPFYHPSQRQVWVQRLGKHGAPTKHEVEVYILYDHDIVERMRRTATEAFREAMRKVAEWNKRCTREHLSFDGSRARR